LRERVLSTSQGNDERVCIAMLLNHLCTMHLTKHSPVSKARNSQTQKGIERLSTTETANAPLIQ
jgi:hypothetical protein